MATVTWLHLSDLHACTPRFAWDAERVTETLVADLKKLQRDHGLRPDLIFFTGDAAFGEIGTEPEKTIRGQLERFDAFLREVRSAFDPEIPPEDVFLVPGNHDVHRGLAMPEHTAWFGGQQAIEPVRALIQAGGLRWRYYMERLRDYRTFLEESGFRHLLDDPERLIYSTVREVNGIRVGVAGFNSAWSCCRDGERGHLWMAGKWQQGTLRAAIKDADFSIALVHHPPDWLVEHENPDFGRGLDQDFRFLLHGHEHRDWVLNTADGYVVVAAGACYERSDAEHNGYNVVRLDVGEGRGEVWLRRFESAGGGWIPRMISRKAETGVWNLRLDWLEDLKRKRRRRAPKETPRAPRPVAEPEASTSELDRYRQRLRAACRDLPILGFETRVRLPIHLDEVYIPLRARALRTATEREFGALRELAAEVEQDRDVTFDDALRLAAEHGLRGAVVLGDPGSGKTTLLKHFVLAATDPLIGPATLELPPDTVPVLVELRRLSDPAAGLKAAIEVAVAGADVALDAPEFTRELLGRDRLLVLIDGLDEVADAGARASVSSWLEAALAQLPDSTFVVSSRYAGYKGDARLSGRFIELHVRDVEEDAARRFIAAWYGAVEAQAELGRDPEVAAALAKEASDDLAQKIFRPTDPRTSSLKELATNPLMLQILCLVHRDRKQLPERRVELYRECVQVLLELWRRAKGMRVDLDAPQALRLLRPLAYELHKTKRREARVDELLPHLAEPLRELRCPPEEAAALLETIRDQSGVLVSLGQSKFGFLHLSFQEYLCALHIQDRSLRHPEILAELAGHFGDPWWREVILLSLGLDAPSLFEPLMDELLKLGALGRDVRLADDCLRDALAATPRPFLRALAAGIDSAEERYHALRLLRALPDWESAQVGGRSGKDVVEELARHDEDRAARGMALEVLAAEIADLILVTPGRERVNEEDGSVLVHVPGGELTLGTDEDLEAYGDREARHWPKPQHQVVLSQFWIGKYPVTNEQYARFLGANPAERKPNYWGDKQFNEPRQPVVGVSWFEAMAYCRWAGLELPSEAQWEAAARGMDVRPFPWGKEQPSEKLANFGRRVGRPSPVGAYPEGAGPYGTLDQAGNVWEWCLDAWDEKAYLNRDRQRDPVVAANESHERALRVVRGGSWVNPSGDLRAAVRSRNRAKSRVRDLGFRVVCRFGPEHGS